MLAASLAPLEHAVAIDQRRALLDDAAAAHRRRQDIAVEIAAAPERSKAAMAAAHDAEIAVQRLRANSGGGAYEAVQRLDRHRAAHPEIDESQSAETTP